MPETPLRILQVSTADRLGGAERVAWNLFAAYRARGHDSSLAVGRKKTGDAGVFEIRNDLATAGVRRWAWQCYHAAQPYYERSAIVRRLARFAHRIASPEGRRDRLAGFEDFNYPGTAKLLDLAPHPPDIVHCHNLHGGYFDLRALPALCSGRSVVLTLHDAWLLAGHCAHGLDCERWVTGCGACPYLSVYPAVARDETAENWRRKRDIFRQCRLHVATPSRWLMSRAQESILEPAMLGSRVIPNGVDQAVFRPGDRAEARALLGVDPNAFVLLFAAFGVRSNPYKDHATLEAAFARLAGRTRTRKLILLALGENGPSRHIGNAELRCVPFVDDPVFVARYYQAADIYVHAAKVDTFPNSVIEALSCGTPVVATAVGGIPEQVRAWPAPEATGILTKPGDSEDFARAVERLLGDTILLRAMGDAAWRDAAVRFSLDRQTTAYLDWYAEVLSETSRQRGKMPPAHGSNSTAPKASAFDVISHGSQASGLKPPSTAIRGTAFSFNPRS